MYTKKANSNAIAAAKLRIQWNGDELADLGEHLSIICNWTKRVMSWPSFSMVNIN